MLKLSLLVAAGGAIGAVTRFWVGKLMVSSFGVASLWGTLAVNVVGCFLAGVFLAWSNMRSDTLELRALVMVGFLGGLTTFSAFSVDAITLWMRGEERFATFYVLLSLLTSVLAVAVGVLVTRRFVLV